MCPSLNSGALAVPRKPKNSGTATGGLPTRDKNGSAVVSNDVEWSWLFPSERVSVRLSVCESVYKTTDQ